MFFDTAYIKVPMINCQMQNYIYLYLTLTELNSEEYSAAKNASPKYKGEKKV